MCGGAVCRFFTEIASDCETVDSSGHSLSFISDANVLALHRLLWINQERIGDYLSSSRCVPAPTSSPHPHPPAHRRLPLQQQVRAACVRACVRQNRLSSSVNQ